MCELWTDVACRWMAMESFMDGVFTVTSDMWMFGVLMWGM